MGKNAGVRSGYATDVGGQAPRWALGTELEYFPRLRDNRLREPALVLAEWSSALDVPRRGFREIFPGSLEEARMRMENLVALANTLPCFPSRCFVKQCLRDATTCGKNTRPNPMRKFILGNDGGVAKTRTTSDSKITDLLQQRGAIRRSKIFRRMHANLAVRS